MKFFIVIIRGTSLGISKFIFKNIYTFKLMLDNETEQSIFLHQCCRRPNTQMVTLERQEKCEIISADCKDVEDKGSTACTILSNTIKNIVKLFDPIIDLFIDIDKLEKEGIKLDSNKLKEEFEKLEQNLIKYKASGETIEAVKKIKEEDFSKVNLKELIEDWKKSKDNAQLLRIAKKIEADECVKLNETELKQVLLKGLQSLYESIEEAKKKNNPKAVEKLEKAAKPIVDSVEIADKNKGERLTNSEKKKIAGKLEESKSEVKELLEDKELSKCLSDTVSELASWFDYITDFLSDFWETIRKEDEKREKERQCEKRHEELREIELLHSLHKKAENEKIKFLSLMKKAILEADIAIKIAKAELNNIVINRGKHNMEMEKARREQSKLMHAESMYRKEANKEMYFQSDEYYMTENLPPSSVCEHEFSFGINFDFHC